MRRRPWILGFVGIAIGLGQAPTAVPYLAGLAMLSAHYPEPRIWPLLILAYCLIALLPSILVLFLATRRNMRAQRIQRTLVRALTRYGPIAVRVLFLVIGIVLVSDALIHHDDLW